MYLHSRGSGPPPGGHIPNRMALPGDPVRASNRDTGLPLCRPAQVLVLSVDVICGLTPAHTHPELQLANYDTTLGIWQMYLGLYDQFRRWYGYSPLDVNYPDHNTPGKIAQDKLYIVQKSDGCGTVTISQPGESGQPHRFSIFTGAGISNPSAPVCGVTVYVQNLDDAPDAESVVGYHEMVSLRDYSGPLRVPPAKVLMPWYSFKFLDGKHHNREYLDAHCVDMIANHTDLTSELSMSIFRPACTTLSLLWSTKELVSPTKAVALYYRSVRLKGEGGEEWTGSAQTDGLLVHCHGDRGRIPQRLTSPSVSVLVELSPGEDHVHVVGCSLPCCPTEPSACEKHEADGSCRRCRSKRHKLTTGLYCSVLPAWIEKVQYTSAAQVGITNYLQSHSVGCCVVEGQLHATKRRGAFDLHLYHARTDRVHSNSLKTLHKVRKAFQLGCMVDMLRRRAANDNCEY
jgi:hypothetical protein